MDLRMTAFARCGLAPNGPPMRRGCARVCWPDPFQRWRQAPQVLSRRIALATVSPCTIVAYESTGDGMNFQQSVKVCLTKYADFTGRASRPEYWWFVLIVFLAQKGTVDEAMASTNAPGEVA